MTVSERFQKRMELTERAKANPGTRVKFEDGVYVYCDAAGLVHTIRRDDNTSNGYWGRWYTGSLANYRYASGTLKRLIADIERDVEKKTAEERIEREASNEAYNQVKALEA